MKNGKASIYDFDIEQRAKIIQQFQKSEKPNATTCTTVKALRHSVVDFVGGHCRVGLDKECWT
jgi:hypothetical protein